MRNHVASETSVVDRNCSVTVRPLYAIRSIAAGLKYVPFVFESLDELLLLSVSFVVVVAPLTMLTERKSYGPVFAVSCVTMFVQKVSDAAVAFAGMVMLCVSVSV